MLIFGLINENSMKANIACITILSLLLSCTKEAKDNVISIDLDKCTEELTYSQFVKHLDYVTLNLSDTNLLTGIKKIFFDQDTIIIQDSRKEGIFLFTSNGQFVQHINRKGQGPEEYLSDNAVAVDTDLNRIYVYDMMNFKIMEYNYTGHFLAGHKMPYFIRDFAKIGTHDFIMIQPCIHHAYPNNGIWKYSLKEGLSRQFLTYPDQKDQNFEFISTYIVQTPDFVYHYDRNSDALYRINQDSLEEMYSIDLKQVLPLQARLQAMPKKQELERKAMLYDFSVSSNYVLLNYFLFEEDNPYRYVLINRENPTSPTIYYTLVNDLDDKVSSENKLYYVNDSTWCKMVDYADNDTIIQLQMLHLK